jgi:hypothetical protein
MNGIYSAELGNRYATRFAFDMVEPALKRGATLDCRYRGRRGSGTLDRSRRPAVDYLYRGKGGRICLAELGSRYATRFAFDVVEPALKRGAKLDCRYRGRSGGSRPKQCAVAMPVDKGQHPSIEGPDTPVAAIAAKGRRASDLGRIGSRRAGRMFGLRTDG